HVFSLLVSNRTPVMLGVFFCARSGQARRRTLALTTSKENHVFSLLVSNRTPVMLGVFFCARSGQARRRTLA
ncbi:hypothetical protein CKJ90_32525, partial [Klebsiella pneumoniae]